jgi:hypothetical protein
MLCLGTVYGNGLSACDWDREGGKLVLAFQEDIVFASDHLSALPPPTACCACCTSGSTGSTGGSGSSSGSCCTWSRDESTVELTTRLATLARNTSSGSVVLRREHKLHGIANIGLYRRRRKGETSIRTHDDGNVGGEGSWDEPEKRRLGEMHFEQEGTCIG